jgi:predicted amidohydrolase
MSEKKPWQRGTYEKVPLRSDEIRVAVVQSRLAIGQAIENRKENLDHMLQLIDSTQGRDPKDLLAFHEFPIGGSPPGPTRKDSVAAALEVPGPETDAIAERCKKYNCYIAFGAYTKMSEWLELGLHFFNTGIVIGPNGKIVLKHIKMRNLSGFGFSSTVNDILDKYVEIYGWDAVFPVARTDIGNIAMNPCVGEPEMGRAFAIKGAELVIRYMTGGAGHWQFKPVKNLGGMKHHTFIIDFQGLCIQNHFYGLFVNNAIREGRLDTGSGWSTIFDCDGKILKQASHEHETVLIDTLPMASYRKCHTLPLWPKDLYMHLFEEYVPKWPANTFLEDQPNSFVGSIRFYKERQRWSDQTFG